MAKDVEFNYTASDKTGTAAASVRREMKKTGDEADKTNSRVAKGIVQLAGAVSPKVAASLTRGFESVAEAAPQLIVGGIAATAPLAGSLLSAGIIGGIGLGGIVGGVVLAAKDPRVQGAFSAMKTRIGMELTDAAQPFVDTTIHGIDAIGSAVESIDFKSIFADSARNAEPVIDGIASAVRSLGSGIETVVAESGPVLEQVGASIADLGQHAGQFLETVAGGSEGAAAGLRDVTGTVNTLLDVLGPTIRGLTEVYGFLSKIGVAGQFMTSLLGPLGQAADLLDKAGIIGGHASGQMKLVQKGLDDVGGAAAAAAGPIQTFTDRVDQLANEGRSLYDSTTQVGAAIDNVTAAARKNGKTLDENTAKGRTNREALSNLAGALVANYDAYVKVNGEGARSNAVAAQNRAQFIKLATQFGVSRKAAGALASEMGLIPAKKTTNYYANTHDAAARVQALKEQIASVHGKSVKITVAYAYKTFGKPATVVDPNGYRGYAAGSTFIYGGPGANVGRAEPARAPMAERLDNYLTVNLDGQTIYSTTQRQVRAASKRDAWRQKVGRR